MSNWQGAARTNYVKCDEDIATAFAEKWGLTMIYDKEGRIGFHPSQSSDDGDFPSVLYGEDESEDENFDWGEFTDTLPDGECLVVEVVGYEKLRYLTGHATAYTNKGIVASISLGQLTEKLKGLGLKPTPPSY